MDSNLEQVGALLARANTLRPPIQAVLQFVVQGARTAIQLAPEKSDEIWAATVVNVAQGLKLDLESPGGMSMACSVAELVMQLAGKGELE